MFLLLILYTVTFYDIRDGITRQWGEKNHSNDKNPIYKLKSHFHIIFRELQALLITL